jgi:hypothetical protein
MIKICFFFKTVKITTTPRIGVIKDFSDFTFYDPSVLSLERFVQLEQFLTFAEVSRKLMEN